MGTKIPQTPIVVTGLVYAAQAPYSTSWLECAAGDLILAPGGYRDILVREGVIDPGAALAAVGDVNSRPGKSVLPIEPRPAPTADDAPIAAAEGEDRMVREASRRAPARGRGRGRQGGTSR